MSNFIEKIIKKPNDIYEFLNEYMNQFDADWKNKIEPASEEEILNLKKVSGFEELGYDIPDEYLAFLRHMGRNDGGLISDFWDGYTNIDYIINYYIKNKEYIYKYFIQKNQLIFYTSYISNEPNYFIDVESKVNHNIRCSADASYHKDSYAGSFDKFLVQTAFMIHEKKKYRNKISFGSSWNDVKDLVQRYGDEKLMQSVYYIAEKYGFKTAWFSDKWHYCGFKENTFLFVHRNFAYYGYVVSNNMSEVGNIVNELNNFLNTKIKKEIL